MCAGAVVLFAYEPPPAVPAIVAENGQRLRAKLKNGKLVAERDKAGKFVPMPAITETSLDILQPNNEGSVAEEEDRAEYASDGADVHRTTPVSTTRVCALLQSRLPSWIACISVGGLGVQLRMLPQ